MIARSQTSSDRTARRFVVPPTTILLSVVGSVALNMVLAVNHRPGRYLGT